LEVGFALASSSPFLFSCFEVHDFSLMDGRAWRAFVDLKRVFSQSLISVRQFVDCEAALEISSPRHFLCVFIIKAILYISFEKNEMKYFKTKKKAFSFKETAENEGLLFILALHTHNYSLFVTLFRVFARKTWLPPC
jgi:hypothetical protein